MLFINNIKKIRKALSLFKRAYGGYRRQIFITTILGFIGGLAGGIGISAVIPLFFFHHRSNRRSYRWYFTYFRRPLRKPTLKLSARISFSIHAFAFYCKGRSNFYSQLYKRKSCSTVFKRNSNFND